MLNFIMRNSPPIDFETVRNYPGLETLLQHTNGSVCVPAEEFYAILSKYHEKYPDVSYLFEPDNFPTTKVKRKDLCVINEAKILEDIREGAFSREHRLKAYHCLLELKKASDSPTHATWEALYDDLFKAIMGIE